MELKGQFAPELISVESHRLGKEADSANVFDCCFPVGQVEGAGRIYYVVSVVLGGQVERLVVVALDKAFEGARDWLFVEDKLVLGKRWNLLQHRADVVYTFEKLNVDLEVERNLSLLFLGFELNGLVLLLRNLLGQKFAVLAVLADVGQDLMGLLNLAQTESTKADLDQGTVVKDLIFYGLGLNQ